MPRLTQRFVADISETKRERWHWDTELKGFHVRQRPGAPLSWGIRYQVDGRTRTLSIGPVHEVKANAARERAREVKEKARVGTDEFSEREQRRAIPTIAELAVLHPAKHRPPLIAEKTWKNQKAVWRDHLIPALGKTRADRVTLLQIEQLRERLIEKPFAFNKAVNLLSKALNDFKLPNPTGEVRRNAENHRDVVLSGEEISRVVAELEKEFALGRSEPEVIYLLMLTGLRFSEVAKRKWVDFSHNDGTLFITKTKSKKPRLVYLSKTIADRINARPRSSEFIFPTQTGRRPIAGVYRYWKRILKRAGIREEIRIHDLRHSAASIAHRVGGLSMKEVSEMLGHASVRMTERYLNLHEEQKRVISERATTAIVGHFREFVSLP